MPQLEDKDIIVPGEDFMLLLSATNQGQLTARDIIISLEGLNSDGISLVSGSNRKYIDDLEAETGSEITYLIIAAPELAEGSYPLIIRADYYDQSGAVYSTEQELVLRVSSKLTSGDEEGSGSSLVEIAESKVQKLSRLEVGSIRFSGELKPGKLVNLHCTYYNTGQAMLTNLIIKIEGDFEITDETVFVGDMEQDSSAYYHGTFKPNEIGEITGRLVFSYQDQSGEPLMLAEPFTLNISGQTATSSADDSKQVDKGFDIWYIIFPIVIAGTAVGLNIQRKNRVDEGLPVDEDNSADQ
ncbi:hypothetical protein ASZ90_019516 [hydrocarbon metagenome]|uniref:S-layer domain n=1 Tax=hydrocarbon metagenome TaxID=938273 RepID=A0A0W8E387_9ZZZZ